MVVVLAVDLLARTQHLALNRPIAKAGPKTLRYRLLHVAARIIRRQRQTWVHQLAEAFARLHALPVAAG